MYAPILLAFLISASPPDAVSASATPTEPLKISVGSMSLSGNTIVLIKSDEETFECEINGRAEFALGNDGDTDIAIAAQKIVISRNADLDISVDCTGDCKTKYAEYTCSADRMQVQFADDGPAKLQLFGHAHIEYGTGENQTKLTAESITFEGGRFSLSGHASLKHGQ